jgi:hypothetical protein
VNLDFSDEEPTALMHEPEHIVDSDRYPFSLCNLRLTDLLGELRLGAGQRGPTGGVGVCPESAGHITGWRT